MPHEQVPQERSKEALKKAEGEILNKRNTPEYRKLFSDSYDADCNRDVEKCKELMGQLDVINQQIVGEHQNFLDSLSTQEQIFYNEEKAKYISSRVQEYLRQIADLPDSQTVEITYVDDLGSEDSSSETETLTAGEAWSKLLEIQEKCERGLTFQDIGKLHENKIFDCLDSAGGQTIYIQAIGDTSAIRKLSVDVATEKAEKKYDELLFRDLGSEAKPGDAEFDAAAKQMESARETRRNYRDRLVEYRKKKSEQKGK